MNEVDELMDEGHTALALGDLEEASTFYRKAVEIDPEFFDGWHALAVALMKLEKYEESIEAGKRAIELRPNEQMAYTSLSITYARNHQIAEAEEMASKARVVSWGGNIKKMEEQEKKDS